MLTERGYGLHAVTPVDAEVLQASHAIALLKLANQVVHDTIHHSAFATVALVLTPEVES